MSDENYSAENYRISLKKNYSWLFQSFFRNHSKIERRYFSLIFKSIAFFAGDAKINFSNAPSCREQKILSTKQYLSGNYNSFSHIRSEVVIKNDYKM